VDYLFDLLFIQQSFIQKAKKQRRLFAQEVSDQCPTILYFLYLYTSQALWFTQVINYFLDKQMSSSVQFCSSTYWLINNKKHMTIIIYHCNVMSLFMWLKNSKRSELHLFSDFCWTTFEEEVFRKWKLGGKLSMVFLKVWQHHYLIKFGNLINIFNYNYFIS